ncbi:MAG: hypothetical protein ACTSV2_19105 [Candidatus Thorarchaeota archaeon]
MGNAIELGNNSGLDSILLSTSHPYNLLSEHPLVVNIVNMEPSISSVLAITAGITSLFAIIVTIIALYLRFTSPHTSREVGTDTAKSFADPPSGSWTSMSYIEFKRFLSNLLLDDEIAVVETMAGLFVENGAMIDPDNSSTNSSKGWRNKHRIASESGVTQKRVYNRGGIIDRLIALELVEKRDSDTAWGKQKYLYRLNIGNDFVQAYLRALGETLTPV